MSFRVIHGSPQNIWVDVDATDTLYVGQLVMHGDNARANTGCEPLGVASGTSDKTGLNLPFGIILGNNNRTPVYDTTYLCNSIVGVTTQAAIAARDWIGAEGPHAKGDGAAKVEIAIVDPSTVIEGKCFDTTYGTVLETDTDSDGTDTTGYTTAGLTSAVSFTPVARRATFYCRAGANQGIYRVRIDASTTAPQVETAFPYDVASGDTFVAVPFTIGYSRMQFDAESMFIDCNAAINGSWYDVYVHKIDLETSGREVAQFRFAPHHFNGVVTRGG
jgi:hypothetical protein